jgi:hypothetical protein
VQAIAPLQQVAPPRAPNLVGLSTNDAYRALSQLGLGAKYVYLDTPDDAVLYHHVAATVPAAGAFVTDGVVNLQIARPRAPTFAGALSVIDVIRRDGFDFDQGRYEQILRGADMVLREDKTAIPHVDINGRTYYTTKGLFVEPSDGAVFAVPGAYGISPDQYPGGLGSAPNYVACSQALSQSRAAYLNLPRPDEYGTDLVFCALTSSRQIAVVHFRKGDIACCGKDNYKFYVAVFPIQKIKPMRAKSVLEPVRRVTSP